MEVGVCEEEEGDFEGRVFLGGEVEGSRRLVGGAGWVVVGEGEGAVEEGGVVEFVGGGNGGREVAGREDAGGEEEEEWEGEEEGEGQDEWG